MMSKKSWKMNLSFMWRLRLTLVGLAFFSFILWIILLKIISPRIPFSQVNTALVWTLSWIISAATLFVLTFAHELFKLAVYVFRGLVFLFKKGKEHTQRVEAKIKEHTVMKKRSSIEARYQALDVLKTDEGSFDDWMDKIKESDSTIGIIVGARGSGKTAFGIRLLENLYAKKKNKCYAMGFSEEEMPSWIDVVEETKEIENDSYVLIDEGGVLFSSRRAMSNANKLLSEMLLVSRHKNLSIIFIAQNSSNLDVNIIRQADYLVFKRSSLLQKDFERKIIREMYDKIEKDFSRYKDKGTTYIYSDVFRGFVKNELPSFWSMKISKSFSKK